MNIRRKPTTEELILVRAALGSSYRPSIFSVDVDGVIHASDPKAPGSPEFRISAEGKILSVKRSGDVEHYELG